MYSLMTRTLSAGIFRSRAISVRQLAIPWVAAWTVSLSPLYSAMETRISSWALL
jgi:hypothetical protein